LTIAACYRSPEGLVFGADSTTTYSLAAPPFMPRQDRHYNYGQKIFEVGEMGTLGMVTWGLGGLQTGSYRTFIAQLADDLKTSPAKSVREVAERWASRFWVEYSTSLSNEIKSLTTISGKRQFDPSKPAGDGDHRSLQEEVYFQTARNQLVAGFCLGGYTPEDRTPEAFQIIFDPLLACARNTAAGSIILGRAGPYHSTYKRLCGRGCGRHPLFRLLAGNRIRPNKLNWPP